MPNGTLLLDTTKLGDTVLTLLTYWPENLTYQVGRSSLSLLGQYGFIVRATPGRLFKLFKSCMIC